MLDNTTAPWWSKAVDNVWVSVWERVANDNAGSGTKSHKMQGGHSPYYVGSIKRIFQLSVNSSYTTVVLALGGCVHRPVQCIDGPASPSQALSCDSPQNKSTLPGKDEDSHHLFERWFFLRKVWVGETGKRKANEDCVNKWVPLWKAGTQSSRRKCIKVVQGRGQEAGTFYINSSCCWLRIISKVPA